MRKFRSAHEVITDDKRVKAMAKKAGCWAPLRAAQRNGQTVAVWSGRTLYGSFHDGLVAVVCADPVHVLEIIASLQPSMGYKLAGFHQGGEVH